MGTRGAYGFFVENKEKVTYNHFDSYPASLGVEVIHFIKNTKNEKIKSIARSIRLIDDSQQEVIQKMREGDLSIYQDGFKFMLDRVDFLADSLFCEYAYIINCDEEVLEFYAGANKDPNAPGRYASLKRKNKYDYVGIKLLKCFPWKFVRETDTEMLWMYMDRLETLDELKRDPSDSYLRSLLDCVPSLSFGT